MATGAFWSTPNLPGSPDFDPTKPVANTTRPSAFTYVDETVGAGDVTKEYQNRDYSPLNIKGDETSGFDARVRGGSDNWDYVDGIPYYTDADGQPTTKIPTSSGITPTTGGGQTYTGTPPPPPDDWSFVGDPVVTPQPPIRDGNHEPPPPGGYPPPDYGQLPPPPGPAYGKGGQGDGWATQQTGIYDAFRNPNRPMAGSQPPKQPMGINPGVYGKMPPAGGKGGQAAQMAPQLQQAAGKGGTPQAPASSQQMLMDTLTKMMNQPDQGGNSG